MNNKLGKPLEDLQTDDMIRLFGSSISEKDLEDPESREIILAFLNDRIKEDIYEIEYMVQKMYFHMTSLLIYRDAKISSNYTEDDSVAEAATIETVEEYLYHLRSYKNNCESTWNSVNFNELEKEYIKTVSDSPDDQAVIRLLSINHLVDNIKSKEDIQNLVKELIKYEKF